MQPPHPELWVPHNHPPRSNKFSILMWIFGQLGALITGGILLFGIIMLAAYEGLSGTGPNILVVLATFCAIWVGISIVLGTIQAFCLATSGFRVSFWILATALYGVITGLGITIIAALSIFDGIVKLILLGLWGGLGIIQAILLSSHHRRLSYYWVLAGIAGSLACLMCTSKDDTSIELMGAMFVGAMVYSVITGLFAFIEKPQ